MSCKLENEIYKGILNIYSNPNNEDQYGQVGVWNFTENHMRTILTEEAFNYLNANKSIYAIFSTYGGRFGTYKALTLKNTFYERRRGLGL